MLNVMRKYMPKPLKDILRKQYEFFKRVPKNRRGAKPFIGGIGRNWDLNLNVPREYRKRFIESSIGGIVDLDIDGDKKNVLLCAQPKSASLYITQVLAMALGYDNHQIGFDLGGGPIYYPRLLAAKFTGNNTISHCHADANPQTIKLIKTLHLKTIVLTRNLLDTIVSRRDMLIKDKRTSNILSPGATARFLDGSLEIQIDVIIDLFAASYINFFTGWKLYENDDLISPIFVTYEEINLDEIGLVKRVANALDEKVSVDRILQITSNIKAQGGINFNKGIIGRGKKMINDRQIEQLRRLAISLGCNDKEFLGFDLE